MPPIFALIQERGDVSEEEMHDVFNMGCGFCVVVPAADEGAALELLRAHYPGGASGSGAPAIEGPRARSHRSHERAVASARTVSTERWIDRPLASHNVQPH